MTNKKEKPIRYILVALCGLLTLGNVIKFSITGQWARLLLALLTLVLILIPEGIERLFHCHISQGMYLTAVLYAIGPMLGHCNNLYYILPFWDKMLHILGGVMFVFLGIFLFALLGGDQKSWVLCCLFALCFSLAVSVLWADKNRHPVFQRRETVPADCLSPLDGCSHQTGWHRFLCKFCRMERDGPICLV